ncbi:MAG: bacillithiol biosynthesis BshC, partial [Flavobacteriales bacterium]|nr:bacillithiol biosynthesis BshC [Flavobacteriales bacterium]
KESKLVSALYNALKERAKDVDASLVGSLEAEEKKMHKGVEQWGSRFSRGLKKKNEVSLNRIRKIHAKLFPGGYLQERHDNFLSFYASEGDEFLNEVYENTDPFSKDFRVLSFGK